jgi:rhodanese-related sulfurtransferase
MISLQMIKTFEKKVFFYAKELIKKNINHIIYWVVNMIPSISIKQLKHKKNIIDIRSIENYNNNHIPDAINIPFEKLIVEPGKYLNKNTMYYLYCRSGITSMKACEILIRLGYKVTNITGGYEKWILEN